PRLEPLEDRTLLDRGLGQPPALPDAAQIVQGYYQDLLGRIPAPEEVAGWVARMGAGLSAQQVQEQFLASPEYRTNLICDDYWTLLGRAPVGNDVAFWLGQLNAGLTPDQTKTAFVGSPEYFQEQNNNPTAWLSAAYGDLLGRTPDPRGAAYWGELL